MGPFPFIGFPNPVLNAGFFPESNRVSELYDFYLLAFSNNDSIGENWYTPYSLYLSTVNSLNAPIYNGGLVLVLPSPFPEITGTQTLIFYVRNPQLYATNSSQQIVITLNLTDGIVTSNSYSFAGTIAETGNLDSPILAIEKEIKKTLEVYSQNGAAIFNNYYKWDRTTETATSGLIRAKDWALTESVANRTPLPTNPFQGNDWVLVEPLTGAENYILTLFGQVVNFAFDATKTIANLITYVNSLQFPSGFSVVIADNATDFIEISIYGPSSGFKLIGYFDTVWTWQRFYTDAIPTPTTFYTVGDFIGQWPFLPNTGRFFMEQWYDVEDLSFIDSEPENEDTYNQPIKSGDQLQFNIVPEISNITDLTGCEIGIFDCDGAFIQKVGDAALPACKLNFEFKIIFAANFFSAFSIDPSDIVFNLLDGNSEIIQEFITMPEGLLDFTNQTDFFQSIVDYIQANSDVSVSFTLEEFGPDVRFVFPNVPCDMQGINAVATIETNGGVFPGVCACGCATQLQATIAIPYLPDGNYYLGLYNSTGYINEVFAFSNALSLDNSETFSTIWQFGSSENVIIEGFEYYGGWLQRLRLPINGGGQKPKIEESIYRNSDGTYQRPSNYSDLTVDLHSDYLDLETRNAVASATRCPILIFDSTSIFVSGDLDVATVQDFSNKTSFRKLAQMKFSALIQGFQPDNNNCIGC